MPIQKNDRTKTAVLMLVWSVSGKFPSLDIGSGDLKPSTNEGKHKIVFFFLFPKLILQNQYHGSGSDQTVLFLDT